MIIIGESRAFRSNTIFDFEVAALHPDLETELYTLSADRGSGSKRVS